MSTNIDQNIRELKADRLEQTNRIKVFALEGLASELLPPGSGCLVYANHEAELFDVLQNAVESADRAAIETATDELKQLAGATVSIDDAYDRLKRSPVIIDLYYGTKYLVANAFLGDAGIGRVFFPYIGGEYDHQRFRISEFLNEPDADRLRAFVVVHAPPLTPRERAVISRLPSEMNEMLFGPAAFGSPGEVMCTPGAFVATITVGLLVAAVGTALTHCSPLFDRLGPISNPNPLDRNAGVAVRQLLAVRRAMLAQPVIG